MDSLLPDNQVHGRDNPATNITNAEQARGAASPADTPNIAQDKLPPIACACPEDMPAVPLQKPTSPKHEQGVLDSSTDPTSGPRSTLPAFLGRNLPVLVFVLVGQCCRSRHC